MIGMTLKERLTHGDIDHVLTRDEVNRILGLLENEDQTEALDDAYEEGKEAGIDEGRDEGIETGREKQAAETLEQLEDLTKEHGENLQAVIDGLKKWLED